MSDKPLYKPEVSLDLRDLVILKCFIEKGYRSNLFNSQEEPAIKHVQDKILAILEGAAKFARDIKPE